MELRHLKYFVAVAEALHFGRAAAALGMAQPPLSRQIQRLESDLSVRLFDRTKRHVELTAAGKVFLDRAKRVLEQADLAVTAARRAAAGQTGALAVGFVGSATYGVLPDVLRTFRRRHPDVELMLNEMGSTAQQRAVAEGRLQLGLIRTPAGPAGLDDALAEIIIQRERLMVALPRSHALAKVEALPLSKLSTEPFILFPRESRPSYSEVVIAACARAGFAPKIAQETQEMQTAISLVAAGMGVTLVPESVKSLRRENVIYRPLAPPAPVSELTAVHRRGDDSPVLSAFLAVMRDAVAKRAP
jgi:LysR family transcriptional regulator, benzoate and cis,cis-muconate-responsive activator of ben and cat genes